MESFIWNFLVRRRFGTLLACILVPGMVCGGSAFSGFSIASAAGMLVGAMIGGALGLFAFVILSAHDWLTYETINRKQRGECTKKLAWIKLALYLIVFPALLLTVLIIFVYKMY